MGAIALAIGMIEAGALVDQKMLARWPLLFGAGAAGSRGLLAAIASSMITVAGVVFSITIVALSLASSQYTSRVLRNCMRDRSRAAIRLTSLPTAETNALSATPKTKRA